MEAAGLWVAVVGACAAVAAAVFAFMQAKAATDGRKDAEAARDEARSARDESARLAAEANNAFVRQAEAQEEANRLKREELEPDDWSGPVNVSGSLWRMSNTSGGSLIVASIEVEPQSASGLIRIRTSHDDGRYAFGDSFDFMRVRASGIRPEKLTILYRREGDPVDGVREVVIGL